MENVAYSAAGYPAHAHQIVWEVDASRHFRRMLAGSCRKATSVKERGSSGETTIISQMDCAPFNIICICRASNARYISSFIDKQKGSRFVEHTFWLLLVHTPKCRASKREALEAVSAWYENSCFRQPVAILALVSWMQL